MKKALSLVLAVLLILGIVPLTATAVPITPTIPVSSIEFEFEEIPAVGKKIVLPKVVAVNGDKSLADVVDISLSYWGESDVALSFAYFEKVAEGARFENEKAYKLSLSATLSEEYYFVFGTTVTVKTPEKELVGATAVSGFEANYLTMINFGAPANYITVKKYELKLKGFKIGNRTDNATVDVFLNGKKSREAQVNIDCDYLCMTTTADPEKMTVLYETIKKNKQYYLVMFEEQKPNYIIDYDNPDIFSVNGIKPIIKKSEHGYMLFFKLPILHDHAYKTTTVKATLTKNGKMERKCTVCGYISSASSTIKKINSVKLSGTAYTYNGKIKTPTVTVKDSAGKTVSSKYYTVKYASGRKNVGKYKVTVTFKGNYSDTKTLYFTINPAKTTVSKLTAGKKSIKANVTKKTNISGYQMQYSTSKSFSTYKTKTISYKYTSATLSNLTSKKTYYVRVRTYKTVNGTRYYSGWSAYKYTKTK